jgi:hypothetical protein
MTLRALLAISFLAVASPACALSAPDSAEVDGSGVAGGAETRTVSCGSSATLDRYFAGSGPADIQVTDGTGKSVFSTPTDVTGELNDQQQLAGAAGTWTMTVDAEGFAGQFKVTLQCL